jgi:hypothetical protein
MEITKSSYFANALTAQDMLNKALNRARVDLELQGNTLPLYDRGKSLIDNYDAMRVYSQLEADLALQHLRSMTTPKPINDAKPKNQIVWGQGYSAKGGQYD